MPEIYFGFYYFFLRTSLNMIIIFLFSHKPAELVQKNNYTSTLIRNSKL